ncbi:GNAT family N-acetyltransferase [Thalassobacillus pellis]|uniref:GNAT family N-acetyltransferase n=1 Tax=Thalassobacillus pellis TaxID=748008 RepID=UPI001961E344|nr:GNAT family N-acetyltransferase [Thalassobacillus pellis]
MTANFQPMEFEMETNRLSLSMGKESDASWYRELVAERGQDMPTLTVARDRVISIRDKAMEKGIAPLTIRRRDEGDYIGYSGLIIGRSTLEEPEIAYELFRRVHGNGYATEAASVVLHGAIATGSHRLWSTVRSWNAASFRVLEKIGFRRDHSTWDERGEIVWNVRDL